LVQTGEFNLEKESIMATAKKSAAKGSTRKKGATKNGTVRPQDQLPPIIVKGGSPIRITYPHSDFPHVPGTNHHIRTSGAKIFEIIVEVPSGTVVKTISVPASGDCQVTIRERVA
jgi:hypothetical protein